MKKPALYASLALVVTLSACGDRSPTALESVPGARREVGVMFGSGNRTDPGGNLELDLGPVTVADSGLTVAAVAGVMFGSGN